MSFGRLKLIEAANSAFKARQSPVRVTVVHHHYLALTEIVLGLTSSAFGSVMVRIPFSKSALA